MLNNKIILSKLYSAGNEMKWPWMLSNKLNDVIVNKSVYFSFILYKNCENKYIFHIEYIQLIFYALFMNWDL